MEEYGLIDEGVFLLVVADMVRVKTLVLIKMDIKVVEVVLWGCFLSY